MTHLRQRKSLARVASEAIFGVRMRIGSVALDPLQELGIPSVTTSAAR
jgi:hypothetical protein